MLSGSYYLYAGIALGVIIIIVILLQAARNKEKRRAVSFEAAMADIAETLAWSLAKTGSSASYDE